MPSLPSMRLGHSAPPITMSSGKHTEERGPKLECGHSMASTEMRNRN